VGERDFNDCDFGPLGLGWDFGGTDRTVIKSTMLAGVPIVKIYET
jgi:hypothetical protein